MSPTAPADFEAYEVSSYVSNARNDVNGGNPSSDTLRQVWRNTTVANEIPVDEEFFPAVRAINATLPPARRIRILLGDPPIDWRVVQSRAEHFRWVSLRDSYPAALIQVEVLAKNRRALVVYGQLHYQRQNIMSNLEMNDWRMQTIVSLLQGATPAKIFSVWNADDELTKVDAQVSTWKTPSLAIVRGTTLGAADAAMFLPTRSRFSFQSGAPREVPPEQWRVLRTEDQLDAVLYLGPRAAAKRAPFSKAFCADPREVEERLRRIALSGVPRAEADHVRELCGLIN